MKVKKENAKENVSTYVPKKTNRGLIAIMIVCATLMTLLTVILPIVFAIMVLFVAGNNAEFKVVSDDAIEITNLGLRVSVDDSYYDDKSKCYVLNTRAEIFDKEKYKNIRFINDTVTVTYSFIDDDGYIVGNEAMFIENLDNDKWKFDVNYCGSQAQSVDSFKVESVDNY